MGFGAARFMLGLGESGNFPAAIKAVAEWFPKRERALATGVFNSGTNIGAVVAPLTVPWIAFHLGWPWAFRFTSAFSAIWLVVWLSVYRRPHDKKELSPAELAYIESDPAEPTGKVPWARLLPHRQTWAFVIGKFMTDPIWWFYLFWLAKFFSSEHGLSLTKLSLPLVVIYVMADVGSVGGGWISMQFLKHGWSVNRARKTAMLLCALAVTPVLFVPWIKELWPAVLLLGLATAAHQGWSANIFTLSSDMFPRRAVGSMVGLGGFGGAAGGILFSLFAGFVLQRTHSYVPMFLIAGSAYLLALLVIQLLAPRLQRADIQIAPGSPERV
jgi:ACS family hexuronate transporter-like MFS transporter